MLDWVRVGGGALLRPEEGRLELEEERVAGALPALDSELLRDEREDCEELELDEEDFEADSFCSVLEDRPLDSPLDCASAGLVDNKSPTIRYRGITQRREACDSMVVIGYSSKNSVS